MARKEQGISFTGRKGTTEVCTCRFRSVKEKEETHREFLLYLPKAVPFYEPVL